MEALASTGACMRLAMSPREAEFLQQSCRSRDANSAQFGRSRDSAWANIGQASSQNSRDTTLRRQDAAVPRHRRTSVKIQIDDLVRGILHDLAQPAPSHPELAVFFEAIGASGPRGQQRSVPCWRAGRRTWACRRTLASTLTSSLTRTRISKRPTPVSGKRWLE